MPNSINWFEIPVLNYERAEKFYNTIFGVQLQRTEMGAYLMGFFPADQQSVSGSICKGEGYVPSDTGTLVYLNGGDDLNHVLNKVDGAGGKVLTPKTKITDEIGYFATFRDPEGNKIALHSRG